MPPSAVPIPMPPVSELSRHLIVPLTRQEVRVAMLVGEGLYYPQLAKALGVGEDTVQAHVQRIAIKLSESGVGQAELRGIDRVRFWIVRLQAQTLYQRLQTLEREISKANGTPAQSQGAVERRA